MVNKGVRKAMDYPDDINRGGRLRFWLAGGGRFVDAVKNERGFTKAYLKNFTQCIVFSAV